MKNPKYASRFCEIGNLIRMCIYLQEGLILISCNVEGFVSGVYAEPRDLRKQILSLNLKPVKK